MKQLTLMPPPQPYSHRSKRQSTPSFSQPPYLHKSQISTLLTTNLSLQQQLISLRTSYQQCSNKVQHLQYTNKCLTTQLVKVNTEYEQRIRQIQQYYQQVNIDTQQILAKKQHQKQQQQQQVMLKVNQLNNQLKVQLIERQGLEKRLKQMEEKLVLCTRGKLDSDAMANDYRLKLCESQHFWKNKHHQALTNKIEQANSNYKMQYEQLQRQNMELTYKLSSLNKVLEIKEQQLSRMQNNIRELQL